MGCFSYLCKVCNDPIVFDDDNNIGEHCTLYLLEKGTIIEQMTGQYNHYGHVYSDYPDAYAKWQAYDWDSIVDLEVCHDKKSGIVAVHTDCHPPISHDNRSHSNFNALFDALLETQSPGDPNQGTGDIKHTTEGTYSHNLIKTPKTKRPVINFGAKSNLDLWEKINDGMEELDDLMKKLRKQLDENFK